MKEFKDYFSKSEIVLWSSSVMVIIISFCVFDRINYMTLCASLIGVTSLIFNAKGNPFGQLVVSRFFRTLVCKLWHEWSQPAMEASSMAASRCFIFMYFLLPHWEPATWRSRAQTSIRAELPSGKLPTTRVRRRISRFSLSMTLLVRIRVQCSLGKSQ